MIFYSNKTEWLQNILGQFLEQNGGFEVVSNAPRICTLYSADNLHQIHHGENDEQHRQVLFSWY